jgi:hypothetical protein
MEDGRWKMEETALQCLYPALQKDGRVLAIPASDERWKSTDSPREVFDTESTEKDKDNFTTETQRTQRKILFQKIGRCRFSETSQRLRRRKNF